MSKNSDGRKQLAEVREARWKAGKQAATGRTPEERQRASAEHRELGKLVTELKNEFGDDMVTLI
jgi:hypothetical protein